MAKFAWKILGVTAKDGVITSAKYFVTATDKDYTVETEGNWFFAEPDGKVPFAEVTEDMICDWIDKEAMRDGKHLIKGRLEDQINGLKLEQPTGLPWLAQTFTPNL